jgi:hypothetical protein
MLLYGPQEDTALLPSKMPRSIHGKPPMAFKPVEQYYQLSPPLSSSSRPGLFSSDTGVDISLLSTVFLVLTLLLCAAFFIVALGYLLSNEHDVCEYCPIRAASFALL